MSLPSLMVLYTNDAVEVRYSDGSQLQLSPCGACFVHYHKPTSDQHPAAGHQKLHQRCCFVTSEYRHKVLQALDFRNRFADRPYLCPDLLDKDSIVPLYSEIKDVSWPHLAKNSKTELLPDGGVRLFSEKEFASLTLSSHQRDFTVCYLSKLSQESKTPKPSVLLSSTKSKSESKTDDSVAFKAPPTESVNCDSPDNNTITDLQVKEAVNPVESRYTRVSTPTNFEDQAGEVASVTPYGPTAVFRKYQGGGTETSPGVHDISSISKTSSEGLCTTIDVDITVGAHEKSLEFQSASPNFMCSSNVGEANAAQDVSKTQNPYGIPDESVNDDYRNSDGYVNCSSDLKGTTPASQQLYTWVTRHLSCSECPSQWSLPLKLAQDCVRDIGERWAELSHEVSASLQPVRIDQAVRKTDTKQGPPSSLPPPLPLVCLAQHRHKWPSVDFSEDELDCYSGSRLKVMLVDGMIYRIVHLPAMKVLELYPGDGSVFVSQGVSGQFFTQIIPVSDKLEERTFSVRALPPPRPSAKYPMEKMLKRACRLLCEAVQRDSLPHPLEQPCWKMVPVSITEPMSVGILEEVYIPGSGRFTAHTNGRVRVVFDDRTSLDMLADFTRRVKNCAYHSNGMNEELVAQQAPLKKLGQDNIDRDTCRLLLPSGKYIFISKHKPGSYKRYVEQALEWVSWVNSSPLERKQFYDNLAKNGSAQGSAAAELRKITCFNYILENTFLGGRNPGIDSLTDSHLSEHSDKTNYRPGYQPVGRSADYQFEQTSSSNQFRPIANPLAHPPMGDSVTSHASSVNPIGGSVLPNNCFLQTSSLSGRPLPQSRVGETWTVGSSDRTREILDGFNSVKHALLQTNKLIQDIDEILDKQS